MCQHDFVRVFASKVFAPIAADESLLTVQQMMRLENIKTTGSKREGNRMVAWFKVYPDDSGKIDPMFPPDMFGCGHSVWQMPQDIGGGLKTEDEVLVSIQRKADGTLVQVLYSFVYRREHEEKDRSDARVRLLNAGLRNNAKAWLKTMPQVKGYVPTMFDTASEAMLDRFVSFVTNCFTSIAEASRFFAVAPQTMHVALRQRVGITFFRSLQSDLPAVCDFVLTGKHREVDTKWLNETIISLDEQLKKRKGNRRSPLKLARLCAVRN